MSESYDVRAWDLAGENAMCIECVRSCNKEKMCPWFKTGQPVPGWVTVKAKECPYVSSVKILRCPQFLACENGPELTKPEYRRLCHNLVVNLYSKVCEDKEMLLSRAGQVNALREENETLRKFCGKKKGVSV